jgi:hypothetical protein
MKIRTVPTTKLALLCAALVAALLMFSDRAQAFSIRDADASPGYGHRSTYLDHLAGMAVVRSEERANGQYFRPGNLTPHIVLPDHLDPRNADGGSIEVIRTPIIGGAPNPVGGRVPDGGITAMLLGTALGVLGIARRYIRN